MTDLNDEDAVRAPSSVSARRSGPEPTALVVDDEPGVARLIALALEEAGFRSQRAGTGSDAMDAIEVSPPDVITLDLRLPDISGRELYRRIRDAGIEAPILIVSAYGARLAQRELGADAALEKPFDPGRIQRLARELVDAKRDVDASERSRGDRD